jgi:hypothetical protein
MFPNHFGDLTTYSNRPNDFGNVPALKYSSHWNGDNFHVEFHCPLSQRIPTTSEMDGPKWVCDPHRIAAKKDCLVYSVGSNGNVMFERGVKENIGKHCEIHTFDLVNYNPRNGDFAKALQGLGTFHHWGLGTEEQAAAYKKRKTLPAMKTLKETMIELGHIGRTIDVFKIDCEWYVTK